MGRVFTGYWLGLLTLCAIAFSITLEEAEQRALDNFYETKIARMEIRKKENERLEKLGGLMPEVNLQANFTIAKKQSFSLAVPPAPPQEFVFLKGSYNSFLLQLKQDLFNLTKFREYEIAKTLLELQEDTLREAENKVRFEVRSAYLKALSAKLALEIQEKYLELVRAHLRDVEELYKEGLVAFKDVLETKVKLYEVEEKVESLRSSYNKALEYLSYLVGEEVKEVKDIDGNYEDISLKGREELISTMRNSRPLLKALSKKVRAMEDSVRVVRSYFYPQAVFEAVYQYTEESDLFPKNRYFLTFSLRWNLFSGLRRFRALEVSKISYLQEQERFRDIQRRLELELISLLEDMKAVRLKLKLSEERLREAKEHLRIAKEKYRAGLGTNTEVLNAQSYYISAENQLKLSKYEYLEKIFKLYEVVGYER